MNGDFELLSVDEMRRKYGLTASRRTLKKLNPENVPEALRHLVDLAELWGEGDDLVRDDMIRGATPQAIDELRRLVDANDDALDAWLAGPEANGPRFSDEYRAFTAMRMAADGV